VGISSWYVTSHSGQLNLLPSAGREISTCQEAVAMTCSWEGNHRSGITPGINHRLCGAQWAKGDEYTTYTPVRGMVPFTFSY